MAKSYESLAGKDGNSTGAWYFERTIPELRQLLAIPESAYPRTNTFRAKVVEDPVEEINKAGVGITIKTTGIKQGQRLKGIRFDCNKEGYPLPAKRPRGRPRKTPVTDERLPPPEENAKQTRMEKELDHLRELYPDEFAALYAEEMDKPSFLPPESGFRKATASMTALVRLREKHGIVK
jgi:hypothetical protein